MILAKILTANDKVELINGEIIQMSPIGSKHAALVDQLNNYLAFSLYEKAIVRTQNPIQLAPNSEPEPDLAIVKFQADYYRQQHPVAADILWIIEVVDSSFEFDAIIKSEMYAKALIPEYWIVNLNSKQIEVYTKPNENGYQHKEIYSSPTVIESKTMKLSVDTYKLFASS